MPGVVNLRSHFRPVTLVPSGFAPSKLAPHGPPSSRLPGFAAFAVALVALAFAVYLPPAGLVATLALVAAAPVAAALVAVPALPEPLPADPTSLFVMTGTGAVVARAICVLSSLPGLPGSTPDVVASSRRRLVRPAQLR